MFLFQALAALSLNLAAAQQPLPVLKNSVQDSDEAPMMALSCGPIGELAQGVQSSALVNLMAASLKTNCLILHLANRPKNGSGSCVPAGWTLWGLDEDGSVLIEVWTGLGENIRGSVPLRGSAEQTQELMERIFTQSLVQTDTGWLVMPKILLENLGASKPIQMLGSKTSFSPSANLKPMPSMQKACCKICPIELAAMSWPALKKAWYRPLSVVYSSPSITIPNTPFWSGFKTSINGLKSLSGGTKPPAKAAQWIRPLQSWSLELTCSRYFRSHKFGVDCQMTSRLALTKIQSRVQLPPGLTVAAFGTKDNPDLMVVLPILNARGKSIRPTRLTRLISRNLGSEERTVTRTAKDGFILESNNRTVFGRVVAGKNRAGRKQRTGGRSHQWAKGSHG